MDSSLIRSLIFSAKLTGQVSGQGLSIVFVIQRVLDLAFEKGHLPERMQFKTAPNELTEKILAAVWELVIEGVYTPGSGWQQPNLPFLRATEYGRKCFEAGELTAHDPDDYLRRLKEACRSIDEITILYTEEALNAFRAGNHLASAVMIGVAAEKMLLRLVDAVHAALNTPQRKTKFEKDTRGKKAKTQHDEVLARLRSPVTSLPEEIESVLTQHVSGIYDLIRRTRNDAGHPTGKRMERYETHALLLLFPTYCKTVHDLIGWLAENEI